MCKKNVGGTNHNTGKLFIVLGKYFPILDVSYLIFGFFLNIMSRKHNVVIMCTMSKANHVDDIL